MTHKYANGVLCASPDLLPCIPGAFLYKHGLRMPRPGAERKAVLLELSWGQSPTSRVPAFDFFVSVEPFSGSKCSAPGSVKQRKASQMALYEHIYLARQDVTAQQVETMTEQFKAIIEPHGGSVAKVEYWGVKSLAYRIKKNRKAHFSLLNINAPSAAVVEMERQMSINEDVLRVLTIRVEEHEEVPSAMMRKREDGDRDERGGDRGERRGGGGRFGGGDRPDRAPRRPREDFANEGGQF